jgi:hypothetical protein
MPTVSAARGCSPTARIRRPSGVRKSTNHETGTRISASQIIRLRFPKMSPRNGTPSRNARWMFGMLGMSLGVPSCP